MSDAEEKTTYVIDGTEYARVRYGDEEDDWGGDRGPCHDCGAVKGQLHSTFNCDVERCPVCGGQAIYCDCVYEDDDEDEQ